MGNTSSKVKNRWNAKTYDRICCTIPKGYGDKIKEYCESNGRTLNSTLTEALRRRMGKTTAQSDQNP